MRQLSAFCKKEYTEMIRTGKLLILIIVFVGLGILSPAIAKLTPYMYEMLGDSLAEQGLVITEIKVNALTSWQQFFKNVPMGLIVMVIMFQAILTNELQKGTLINMLTKGLSRWKVIAAKGMISTFVWTICYWLCFLITYGYTVYFWDNSIASHLLFSAACAYLFGIWLISLILLGSCLFRSSVGSLLTVGAGVLASYLLSIIPTMTKWLPMQLMGTWNLVNDVAVVGDYTNSVLVVIGLIVINYIVSVISINHRTV